MTHVRSADRIGRIIVAAGPYVIVAIVTGFTFTGGSGTGAIYGLLGAMTIWMLGLFTLPRALRSRPGAMAVFVAGFFAFVCALTALAPWYGVLALAGYIFSFAVIAWPWRLISVSAFAVLAAIAQANGLHIQDASHIAVTVAIMLLNVGAMCFLTWVYHSMRTLAEERRAALEENERLREQLVARARAEARADERQRLAREIHDTVAQGLVGVITQLDAIDTSAGGTASQDDLHHLDQAAAIARESLREARRAVAELSPAALDGTDLTTAIRRTTEQWGLRAGVSTRLSLPDAAAGVGPDVASTLLRVLQEALANIARHADATLASVTLTWFADALVMDIADDGTGYDPVNVPARPSTAGGYGVIAMRDRMARVGGTIDIESEPGGGTVVSARAPLTPSPNSPRKDPA
ncbi:sensor histidine kinase [Microbacterium sp. ASV49]|uniref:histidine kinase n=1 Tax=Microbacterium candidum TaxID=3041922 RepID=A0ABT7MZ48_9MICO|nr:sensor histidine kinase [Microbacterium sp. ASV49]MDL9979731.1 sensor histidine kinase [Microbacterium sp. ASV49]